MKGLTIGIRRCCSYARHLALIKKVFSTIIEICSCKQCLKRIIYPRFQLHQFRMQNKETFSKSWICHSTLLKTITWTGTLTERVNRALSLLQVCMLKKYCFVKVEITIWINLEELLLVLSINMCQTLNFPCVCFIPSQELVYLRWTGDYLKLRNNESLTMVLEVTWSVLVSSPFMLFLCCSFANTTMTRKRGSKTIMDTGT